MAGRSGRTGGWRSVHVRRSRAGRLYETVLGDHLASVRLYRTGAGDHHVSFKDERTGQWINLLVSGDGTEYVVAEGRTEDEAGDAVVRLRAEGRVP